MGVVFVQNTGGDTRSYSCVACDNYLTNRTDLKSTNFIGYSGQAYLFKTALNINCSKIEDRKLLTGLYTVRDVSCQKCNARLGWYYEHAYDRSQAYKEGQVVLEKALIRPINGIAKRKF